VKFDVDLHILFIDFKKVYDSIKHSAIWKALEELGYPPKLIRKTDTERS
jgi:transposase